MSEHLALAEQALESAKLLVVAGDYNGAINRAYYACFGAARAALADVVGEDVRQIKTHRGLIKQFSLRVVKAGLLAPSIGAIISREQNTRILFDYSGGKSSKEDADTAISSAETFLEACERLLAAGGKKS